MLVFCKLHFLAVNLENFVLHDLVKKFSGGSHGWGKSLYFSSLKVVYLSWSEGDRIWMKMKSLFCHRNLPQTDWPGRVLHFDCLFCQRKRHIMIDRSNESLLIKT